VPHAQVPLQLVQYYLVNNVFPPPESTEERPKEEIEVERTSRVTAELTTSETLVTDNTSSRTTAEYGKFLLDSMAALDSDGEDSHASKESVEEASSDEEFDRLS